MKDFFQKFMKEKYKIDDEDLEKTNPLSPIQTVWLNRAMLLVGLLAILYVGYLIWQFNQPPSLAPSVVDVENSTR